MKKLFNAYWSRANRTNRGNRGNRAMLTSSVCLRLLGVFHRLKICPPRLKQIRANLAGLDELAGEHLQDSNFVRKANG